MKPKTEKRYRTVERVWCTAKQLQRLYTVFTLPKDGEEVFRVSLPRGRRRITKQGAMYLAELQEECK